MNAIRILISNELESYREGLAEALRYLRPDAGVFEAEPGDLDRKVERLRPDLVICSRVSPLVKKSVPSWVELYPNCERGSVVSARGERREVAEIQLSDLLDLVDRVEDSLQQHRTAALQAPRAPEDPTAV
ncbi:MAG: hypothetical protein H0V53_13160 [Rubrobacter sp.]|jgi:hypothetical protein|nr:hypothetical protein [Rubrobacter sp.]